MRPTHINQRRLSADIRLVARRLDSSSSLEEAVFWATNGGAPGRYQEVFRALNEVAMKNHDKSIVELYAQSRGEVGAVFGEAVKAAESVERAVAPPMSL